MPEVAEAVDPGIVAIAPGEAEGVVADGLQPAELKVPILLEGDFSRVPLAGGAGAKSAQNHMWVEVAMPVAPRNLQVSGAVGGFHAGWGKARVGSHTAITFVRSP